MFGQDDPVPPLFSPRISAISMTRPDWGWGARAPSLMPSRGYATDQPRFVHRCGNFRVFAVVAYLMK